MKPQKIIFRETLIVLAGEIICCGLMAGVFALLGRLDSTVWLGILVGLLVAVLNFFFMALTANLAADKAEQQDIPTGKALLQGSYILRLLLLFGILFLCVRTKRFHPLTLVLPLVFVRPALTAGELFRKKGDCP